MESERVEADFDESDRDLEADTEEERNTKPMTHIVQR